MKELFRKLKSISPIALIFIALLVILVFSGIYSCPVRIFLGIPCPLCGISRALKSLARGDLDGAFYYHPLWPAVIIVFIIVILDRLRVIRLTEKIRIVGAVIAGIMLIVCYVIRLVTHTAV